MNLEISTNDEPNKIDYDEETVKEILNSNIDLREYSKNVEKTLNQYEKETIDDYINEADNITELHAQINDSDKILERLEGMLCAFQADLSNICQEILSLQELSASLNIRLKNKQAIQNQMSEFIDDIIIPESVIKHIVDTPVSEKEFLEQLIILDHKIAFVKEQSFREAKSCVDVMEILNNLKTKAINKIREYILKKISSCKKPMTNYHIVQNALLKNKFFYKFLATHERDIAREIQNEYIDTMSKIYYSYFKEFLNKSTKMMYDDLPDKDDLMGNDDAHKTSKTSIFQLKANTLKHRPNIYSLGDRETLLTNDLESSLIVVHAALKNDVKYPIENIFREIQYAFLDHACREYLFLKEFFMVNAKTSHDLFVTVFLKTIDLLNKNVDTFFSQSYDAIALFVCLHIIYRFRIISMKRNVSVLNQYWENLAKMIWPQFEQIFMMHIESVKFYDLNKLSTSTTTTINTRTTHYVARRFAEFAAAIIFINETFPDQRVMNLLTILQNEIINLILRISTKFCKPKEQLIFIINNYDTILTILLEHKKNDGNNSSGASSSSSSVPTSSTLKNSNEIIEIMREQMNKKIIDFIEEILYPHFGPMISFVKESEILFEKNDFDSLKHLESRVNDLIKNFNNNWRNALEQISNDIMSSFTNFRNGNNIQQMALTQLVQYYHKFQKIVNQKPFKNQNSLCGELINIHQLMVEVKKYKTNF